MSPETNLGENFDQRIPNAIERSVILRVHTDIPEEIERERAIIIPGDGISDKEAYGLPSLGDYRIRRRTSDGQLFIKRYRDLGIRIDLTGLNGVNHLDFDKAKIVEAKWPRIPDAETAIRYCDHIADNYDKKNGIQTLSILEVNRLIHELSTELQVPPSERTPLSDLQAKAVKVLVEYGYDRAVNPEKIHMASEVIRALQKDSLDRENPSRGRMILVNTKKYSTKMLLGNENKRNKYRYLAGVIYREREKERFALSQVSNEIKDLVSMEERDYQRIHSENSVRERAVEGISPKVIKMAPYVQIAAEARFLMNSRKTKDDLDRLAGYVGFERAQELFSLPSYYDIKNPKDRVSRLIAISESIDRELDFADANLPFKEVA